MQAYIRSLWMISEMTRIFSPHSIGIQNPYMLWHSQYVITIVAAQVHGCEQMKAYTYHCDFSFRMDVEPAPRAEGHSDSDLAFRTRLSRLLSAGQMVRQQGRIRYHPEDEWWYSPDVIERHQEAIRQALEEARQKAMTYELEPPPD